MRPVVLAVLVSIGALGSLDLQGCDKIDPPASAQTAEAVPLCEHGVQKDICPKCNPKLAAVLQAKKDWCPLHGLPESVCPICHPERGGRPRRSTSGAKGKDDDAKKIHLSDRVLAGSHVRTDPARKEALLGTLSLAGEIVADPDKSARVTSPVGGRLERVAFKEGDTVKKGDVLATVRVPELGKARAAYAATAARATAARANADRLRELADKGLAAKQEALNADVEAVALGREAQASQEQLGAIGSSVGGAGAELALRAPIGGTITRRSAVIGQAVGTDDVLAQIVDLTEVWFLGRVYEKDLGRIEVGRRAVIQTTPYPKDLFAGSVEYLGREVDPGARTFSARIRLANERGLLRVGLFGTARIDTGDAARVPVLVVPRSAVTDIEGKPAVFVKESDGYEKRNVTLGEHDSDKVEVVTGVREGELVIVEGVFTAKTVLLKGSMGDDD